MKIAQVAPLFESVPPSYYGGTERVVSYLTECLVKMGHEVTLFASGDSRTRATLVSTTLEALRLKQFTDPYAPHILQLQQVVEMAAQFDIIHFHTDYLHYPVSRLSAYTHVTTLHGRLDIKELSPLYHKFFDIPVISISLAQRRPLPQANWVGNVYHGLPCDLHLKGHGKGNYAVFIGRISPEKRVDRAIDIAGKLGMPIKVAAKLDGKDKEYFDAEIKRLLKLPHVEFLGEVTEHEKHELLCNAMVMLFPIDWPEPFGMVMIESLACGTPVLAFGHGSVPEIIEHGKTGFVVSSLEEAFEAMKNIHTISRSDCRQAFENRFSCERMASDYIAIYQQMIEENAQIRIPTTVGETNSTLEKTNSGLLKKVVSA